MMNRIRFRMKNIAFCLAGSLITAQSAQAATGGDMPWEAPLRRLVDSIAGPVTQSLLILAVVALGFALAFSEGAALRRVMGVLLGCAIAAAATSFALSFFGFSSGATF